jgi:D-alanyl-D-alanine carboxypeptidase/D-alanyl-D-alanine-endopeptidase (penicillin-binding protein 4)
MHRSDNFFAEQTLLMVSDKILGVMSDAKIIDTLLKTDFASLPQKPKWVDGSGLSRYNLFSPQDFVTVLNKMQQEFVWNRITTILPTGGTGTISSYYKKYAGKIFAKTGTLSNNIALSGYLLTDSGKKLIFSVLVNNHQAPTATIRKDVENFLGWLIEKY